MKSRLLAVAVVVMALAAAWRSTSAQNVSGMGMSVTLPVTCSVGTWTYLTSGTAGLYYCSGTNTWSVLSMLGGNIPTGGIIFIASGSCPTGYAEVSALNGKMIRGTVAANSNVGGTGGSDTITPAGTNSVPALTMNSYTPAGTNGTAAFTPAGTNAAITAGTPAGTNAASATTGNCAATNVAIGTGATNACKATAPNLAVSAQTFTGSALATHTHTFTGSGGTVPAETFTGTPAVLTGSVAAPAFTGTQVDSRAAYISLIGCAKS